MKDLMQKVKSFITFDFPVQATYINTKFAETHQKLQSEVPEWSTTATRQKLISHYWSNHVTGHFSFLFGLPALLIFLLRGGFKDFNGYLLTIIASGIISYLVLYIFHYGPTYSSTYLPRLETAKEAYDGKHYELIQKCRQAQLSNLSLTLLYYVFDKSSGMNTLLCNDQSAGLLMKIFGVDSGSLKKNLELIYGKKKHLQPRKQTEIENCFDEAISIFEETGFSAGVMILKELQKKIV